MGTDEKTPTLEDEKKRPKEGNGEPMKSSSAQKNVVEFLNPRAPVDLSELNTGENPMEIFLRGSKVSTTEEIVTDLTAEIVPPPSEAKVETEAKPAAVRMPPKKRKVVRAIPKDKIEQAAETVEAKPLAEALEVKISAEAVKSEPTAAPAEVGARAPIKETPGPPVTARVETGTHAPRVETPPQPAKPQIQPRAGIMESFIFVPLWYFFLGLLLAGLLGALIGFLSVFR